MKMNLNLWSIILGVSIISLACDGNEKSSNDQPNNETSNPGIDTRIANMLEYPTSAGFPRSMEKDGSIRGVKAGDWTSGFYPGIVWMAYEYTGNEAYKTKAAEWTALMENEKTNPGTHDMGFKMNCSYGNGYRLTQNEQYKQVLITSAKTLDTRYNSAVGCTRSWDFNKEEWTFPVIIDNMMNLELLFLATELTGDSIYYQHAKQHALTTLKNHFRADNSSYHVVDYNPESGAVKVKQTHQGFANESSWARGQAWGLYGYTMAYRFTGDDRFLNQAVAIYEYIINHPNMPDDYVPYWDYNATNLQSQPRDASAAAITASALYELVDYAKDRNMTAYADTIMAALATSNYMMDDKGTNIFLLKHSTGNWPKKDEVDVPIIYADYYYLEALLRKRKKESGL
jgi:unsaturated chondroitin disaccharide hydrolase